MRISLASSPTRIAPEGLSATPFAPEAAVVWGQLFTDDFLPVPLTPNRASLLGPRGICLVAGDLLWVIDTGHHRILAWRSCSTVDQQPADRVIGQLGFNQEGQNAKRTIGLVLGQADFWQGKPNRGEVDTAADPLHWCYGVFYHQGKLFIADAGNRRVLVWSQLPQETGQPVDLVLGQPDFTSLNENGGGSPTAADLRWAHGNTVWNGNLVVADAGNNRVLFWGLQ